MATVGGRFDMLGVRFSVLNAGAFWGAGAALLVSGLPVTWYAFEQTRFQFKPASQCACRVPVITLKVL